MTCNYYLDIDSQLSAIFQLPEAPLGRGREVGGEGARLSRKGQSLSSVICPHFSASKQRKQHTTEVIYHDMTLL